MLKANTTIVETLWMEPVSIKQEPDESGYPVILPPIKREREGEGEEAPPKKFIKVKVRTFTRWNILWKEEIKEEKRKDASFKWRDWPWIHSHRVKPLAVEPRSIQKSWLLTKVLTELDVYTRSLVFEFANLRPCGDQRTYICRVHEVYASSYYGCPKCDQDIYKKVEPWEFKWVNLTGKSKFKPGHFVYNLDQFLYDQSRFLQNPAHVTTLAERF